MVQYTQTLLGQGGAGVHPTVFSALPQSTSLYLVRSIYQSGRTDSVRRLENTYAAPFHTIRMGVTVTIPDKGGNDVQARAGGDLKARAEGVAAAAANSAADVDHDAR